MKPNTVMIAAAIAALLLSLHAAAQELNINSIAVRLQQASENAWSGVAAEDAAALCLKHHREEVHAVGTMLFVNGRQVQLTPASNDHRCAHLDLKTGDGILVRGPRKEPQVWIVLKKPRPRAQR